MKLQFNKSDFGAFQQHLIDNGFRKYNGKLHSEDYYLAKTIHREEDEDGKSRSVLQLFFSVYDFSKYEQFPDITPIHLQAEIRVSRNIDERIDLLIDDDKFKSILELEEFALMFYGFINDTL